MTAFAIVFILRVLTLLAHSPLIPTILLTFFEIFCLATFTDSCILAPLRGIMQPRRVWLVGTGCVRATPDRRSARQKETFLNYLCGTPMSGSPGFYLALASPALFPSILMWFRIFYRTTATPFYTVCIVLTVTLFILLLQKVWCPLCRPDVPSSSLPY